MNRNWIILLSAIVTSACQGTKNTDEVVKPEVAVKRAWDKCIFELDKIEVIRGRNLDDLDNDGFVARNHFMVDCMVVQDVGMTIEQVDEMREYARTRQRRAPSDINLTNGRR